MHIGILGYGEIGKAVSKFYAYGDLHVKDLDRDEFHDTMDAVHICIPFSDTFIDTIVDMFTKYKITFAIIHSTVGTGYNKYAIQYGVQYCTFPN